MVVKTEEADGSSSSRPRAPEVRQRVKLKPPGKGLGEGGVREQTPQFAFVTLALSIR